MYFLWHDNETETKANIIRMVLGGHENDIPENELKKAVKVETYPDPPRKKGYIAEVFINPTTLEYIYEYTEEPEILPDKAEDLKREIQTLKNENNNLKEKFEKELSELQLALTETYEILGGE